METSKLRVAERVAHGGHNIPVKDIERRFPRSLVNLLTIYSSAVDQCRCFMNNSDTPILIFKQQNLDRTIVHDDYFQIILSKAKT